MADAKTIRDTAASNSLAKARERMEEKGTVGAFTAQAKSAGYDNVQEFARHVLANKDDYSGETVKRAQFAANMGKLAKERKE
jgi:hypothetical protein